MNAALEPAPGPAPAALVSWAVAEVWRALDEYWPPVRPSPRQQALLARRIDPGEDPPTLWWRRRRQEMLGEVRRFCERAPTLPQEQLVREMRRVIGRLRSEAVAGWQVLLGEAP